MSQEKKINSWGAKHFGWGGLARFFVCFFLGGKAGNRELSRALVPTFPARSRLSKIHGGLWKTDEFSAVME